MKKQVCIVGALAMLNLNTFGQAKQEKITQLDEVVISATKFELKKDKVGKVIRKITRDEIEKQSGRSIVEILNSITGIEIKGTNSNAGEVKGTYIRGGRDRQVLVLIDGVPVSDPTGINQTYDLRFVSINQIESIEILKGASSTLYGSGAASGVINIILKKAAPSKINGIYEVSLGSNTSAKEQSLKLLDRYQNINLSGSINKFSYLANFGLTGIDGLSSAKSNEENEFEKDHFFSKNGLLKLKYQFTNNLNLQTFLNYDKFDTDFDEAAFKDSDTYHSNQEQIRLGIKPSYNYQNGNAYVLGSYSVIDRASFGFSDTTYKGKSLYLEAVNRYSFSELVQLILGVEYKNYSNETNSPYGNIASDLANFNTFDLYANIVYTGKKGLNLSTGYRLNKHSKYGNYFVYHFNPSYNFLLSDNISTKLLASYSTAFIAPSLYQLFSVYGNLDLAPEINETFEVGFETAYAKKISFNAVVFYRVEDHAIVYRSLNEAPWGKYENSNETIDVKGVELNLRLKPLSFLTVTSGYTYTDKNKEFYYIPNHKVSLNTEFDLSKNAQVTVNYRFVDKRIFGKYNSTTFMVDDETLPAYNLLDINANYKLLNNKVNLFAVVSNILNEDYEETYGYTTKGRNIKFGIRLSL